jgi:hypothetical protein
LLLSQLDWACDFESFEVGQANGQDGAAHGDVLERPLIELESVVQEMVVHLLVAFPAHEVLANRHGFGGDVFLVLTGIHVAAQGITGGHQQVF